MYFIIFYKFYTLYTFEKFLSNFNIMKQNKSEIVKNLLQYKIFNINL